jgi:nucleotide-binding universal stress UspA family protein
MTSPLLIGFDGSPGARRAVRAARELSSATQAIIVTVWEPDLAPYMPAGMGGGFLEPGLPTPGELQAELRIAETLDDRSREQAQQLAASGVALAREAGFEARSVVVADERNVASTLIDVAAEQGAAAIVVGSHGHGGVRARLLGTTSSALLEHARCPVVVVPAGLADTEE